MKIVSASTEILESTTNLEQCIEIAGRVCYKSEGKITSDSAEAFIYRLAESKHESVLEHGAITVRFIVDRGVSHELVRHRLASFSQESTRYCNYSKNKFNSQLTFIKPCFWEEHGLEYTNWKRCCELIESSYLYLLAIGATPQEARSVLPNSLKTEVVMTANPREWKHIFKLRCSKQAHPQMREVMVPLLAEFQQRWPAIFNTAGEESLL